MALSVDGHWTWRDGSVFVTGATGLVGSALVRQLLEGGARVTCLVRDWVPDAELFRNGDADRVSIVWGDVTDRSCLARALGDAEASTVFHLAAQTIVGIANRHPLSTFETNIGGTWRLLEACRELSTIRQIVLASSDKAYGSQDSVALREDMALSARHPYDVSKACGDFIARAYATTYDLPVAIARCCNLFGGGDLNFSRLVPSVIRSVLKGDRPVIRSDGTYVRDYMYVTDAARGYLALAERLAMRPQLRGEAFNFSTERRLSVIDLMKLVLGLMGSGLEPVVLNEVKNEIHHETVSATKSRELLGWAPRVSLEQGLIETIGWYRGFYGEAQPNDTAG